MLLKILRKYFSFRSSANPAAVHLDPPYRQLHWTYLSSFSNWLLFQPSRLSPEYAGTTIPLINSLTDTRNLASLFTLAAYSALGVCVLVRERHDMVKRVGVFALSLLVLPYLPASNLFFPVGFVVAERVLYLPSMGFCMLIGFGAWKMLRNGQKHVSNSTKFLLVSLLVFYTAKTQLQNRVWKSERDLYVSAVRSYPTNSKMWHNLGTQLEGGISLEQSVWLMRRCVENDPHYIAAYSDLGVVLTRLNEKEEAEKVIVPRGDTSLSFYKNARKMLYRSFFCTSATKTRTYMRNIYIYILLGKRPDKCLVEVSVSHFHCRH